MLFRQIPRVEDVKTKLSCDASVKFEELKMLKRSFRALVPSNSKNGRCENEAFVRWFLPISRVEDVTTCLRRSRSNAESVSTHAKHNSAASSKKRENHIEPSVPLARISS